MKRSGLSGGRNRCANCGRPFRLLERQDWGLSQSQPYGSLQALIDRRDRQWPLVALLGPCV